MYVSMNNVIKRIFLYNYYVHHSIRSTNNCLNGTGTTTSGVTVLNAHKLLSWATEPSATEPTTNTTAQLEEEEENVEALRKLC